MATKGAARLDRNQTQMEKLRLFQPEHSIRLKQKRIEIKAIKQIKDIHRAQLPTYMKLSGIDTGLLINFNAEKLKDGIQRFKL
jgi:hypothetical protein